MSYYAIDFGTSNSLMNHISSDGVITPIPLMEDGSFILRSLIFTHEKGVWFFGEDAIREYSENDGEGRFLRSLKKFLPDPNYNGTEIFNKKYFIEDLIGIFIKEMKNRGDKFIGHDVNNIVMGRPAKYSLSSDNDQLAEERMRKACSLAGFSTIHFCPEPLAAGLDFNQANKTEKTVLIADFGGGTSDFTLMKLHAGTYSQEDIIGLSGIFTAGDALDGQMMLKFVAKHFGADFKFKLPMSSEPLTFPRGLLRTICSPAHITHLREKETWDYLKKIQQFAIDEGQKRKITQLFSLVEWQLGYTIFHKIEKSKIAISSQQLDASAPSFHIFNFTHSEIDISEKIELSDYSIHMSPLVEEIMATMMEVFDQSNLSPQDIDEVVLTGGTAQFSDIQRRLKEIFGEKKLVKHDIYQSVVSGLSVFAIQKELPT